MLGRIACRVKMQHTVLVNAGGEYSRVHRRSMHGHVRCRRLFFSEEIVYVLASSINKINARNQNTS
jgi:hypothetical protein